jgi:hypothetical protein
MIYDQALMHAAARHFAERCMSPERVDGATAWIMSRAERDPRLAKQLMERAVSPLPSLEHARSDNEVARPDRVLKKSLRLVDSKLENISTWCNRVLG